MKKFKHLILIYIILFGMALLLENTLIVNKNADSPMQFSSNSLKLSSTTKKWTILVYLDADCNLEEEGIEDVNEMEMEGSDSNINILVQIDRIPEYDDSNGDWTGAKRYYITKDYNSEEIDSSVVQNLGEVNMGAIDSLQNFIQWGKSNYPAEKYALILWDHGSGIMYDGLAGGVCFDDTSDEYLTIDNLEAVLSNPIYYVDFIGIDACLMGGIEIYYELKDYIDVIVASEELIPGDGFPYNDILEYLRSNPTATAQQLGEQMVIKYYNEYSLTEDITLAAVNALNNEFISSCQEFFNDLNDLAITQEANIQNARSASLEFDEDSYIDLYDFADEIQTFCTGSVDISAEYLKNNISDIIIDECHSGSYSDAHGMSIYFPESFTEYSIYYEGHNFANDLLWDEFLIKYYTGSTTGEYDDAFEENDDPTEAALVMPYYLYSTLICNSTDIDCYNISVEAGNLIEVGILFSNAEGDLDLQLYDTSLDLVEGSYSTEDYEYLVHTAEETGYYTIVVYQVTENLYVPYFLMVGTSLVDDPYEENDDLLNAVFISNNTLYTNLVCVDSDYYFFWATEGWLINLSIEFDYSDGDLDLYLYDDFGDLLEASYTATDNEILLYGADYTGYYIIEVFNYEDNPDYSLSANVTNIDDGYEVNNEIDDASILPGYITETDLVCINSDFYNISLNAGIWINITIFFDNDEGDIDLYFYNSTFDEIAASFSSTDNEIIYYNITVSGFYYIEVYNYENNLNYTLAIHETDDIWDDDFEENDWFDQAYLLNLTASYTNLTAIDLDFYLIYASSNYQVNITLDYNLLEGDLDLYLCDTSMEIIDSSTELSNQEQLLLTPSYSGNYYIVVYNYENNMHYNLTISYTIETKPDEGDDGGGGGKKKPGQEINGFLINILLSSIGVSIIIIIIRKKNYQ